MKGKDASVEDKEAVGEVVQRHTFNLLVVCVVAAVVAFNMSGADKAADFIGIPALKHALSVLAVASGVTLLLVKSNSIGGILLKMLAHGISYSFLVVVIYSGMVENKIDSFVNSSGAASDSKEIKVVERLISESLTANDKLMAQQEIDEMAMETAFNSKGESTGKTIYKITNGCNKENQNTRIYSKFCADYTKKVARLAAYSDKTLQELSEELASLRESSSKKSSSSQKIDKFGTLLASNGVDDDQKGKLLDRTALIIAGILESFIFMLISYWQSPRKKDDDENTPKAPSSTVQQTSGNRPAKNTHGIIGVIAEAKAKYDDKREDIKIKREKTQQQRDMELDLVRAIKAINGVALLGVISSRYLPVADQHRTPRLQVCICVAACLWHSVDENGDYSLFKGDGYISQNAFVDDVVSRNSDTMIVKNPSGAESRYMTYGMFKNWVIPIMCDDLRVWRRDDETGRIYQKNEAEMLIALSSVMKRKGQLKSVA